MMKISMIMTFHGEGFLGAPSIRSAEIAMARLGERRPEIECERRIYLDRPTPNMENAIGSMVDASWEVVRVDFGDQGAVRNQAVRDAGGDHIAFLDGDDLWSENWLVEAVKTREKSGDRCIVHPEVYFFFEGANNVLVVPDSRDTAMDPLTLFSVNPWDALCFSPREAHEEFPYAKRDIKTGFAYEDWQWSLETYLAGWHHVPAPDSIIFKRRRANSQTVKASQRNVLTNRARFHSLAEARRMAGLESVSRG